MAAPDSAAQTKSSAILWAAKRVAAHSPIARSAHHTWLRVRCRQRRWTWESWGGKLLRCVCRHGYGHGRHPIRHGGCRRSKQFPLIYIYNRVGSSYTFVTPKGPSVTVRGSRVSDRLGWASSGQRTGRCRCRSPPHCCPPWARGAGAAARLPPLPVRPAGSVRAPLRRRPRASWPEPVRHWPSPCGVSLPARPRRLPGLGLRPRLRCPAFRCR